MEQKKENRLGKKHILFIILTYLGYVVLAFYYNGFGTNAPVVMAFYRITSAQHGLIFTMQSLAGLCVSVYLSLRGERHNKFHVIALGMLMVSAASLAVGFAPPYTALLLLVMVGGVGFSSVDIMANSLIPEIFPKQKNTLLPMAHAFFGAGAMLAPILITMLANPDIPVTFARPFLLIGTLGIGVFLAFVVVSGRIVPETPYADREAARKRASGNRAWIFNQKLAWLFLAAGILYFSFQVGIASWLPSYCREIGMDFDSSGAMLTAFFAGSLAMRFCGPLILTKMTVRKAYILFSLLSAAAVAAALFATAPAVMMALVVAGGFMQGSCVAFLVLMATEAFPQRVASASSLIFISGNIAAMTAPLWMGGIAKTIGFRIPLLLVCALMVFSVILVFLIEKQVERQCSSPADAPKREEPM